METKYTNEQLAQDWFEVVTRYYTGGRDGIQELQKTAARIKNVEINLANFYKTNKTLRNNGVGIGNDVRRVLEAILCDGKETVIQQKDEKEYRRYSMIQISNNRNDKMRPDTDSDSETLEKAGVGQN